MPSLCRYFLFVSLCLVMACKRNGTHSVEVLPVTVADSTSAGEEEDDVDQRYDYQDSAFQLMKYYPVIGDTPTFIRALKANCHIWTRKSRQPFVTINYFKKTSIFGSSKPVYVIEYDYHDGPTASFPYKNQYVFNATGKLLAILSMMRMDIVQLFPNKAPFLFGVSSTGHGNGGHDIYRVRKDTLEQVLDDFIGTRPQTYDRNEDVAVNEPNEFRYRIADVNMDGYNDITFYGNIKHISNDSSMPEKLTPAKYIFLYHQHNGHFIEKEDYSKKYEYIYGNSK